MVPALPPMTGPARARAVRRDAAILRMVSSPSISVVLDPQGVGRPTQDVIDQRVQPVAGQVGALGFVPAFLRVGLVN